MRITAPAGPAIVSNVCDRPNWSDALKAGILSPTAGPGDTAHALPGTSRCHAAESRIVAARSGKDISQNAHSEFSAFPQATFVLLAVNPARDTRLVYRHLDRPVVMKPPLGRAEPGLMSAPARPGLATKRRGLSHHRIAP